MLFQTTKIQIFESNSQPPARLRLTMRCCFRLQRYKFLKAIHNTHLLVTRHIMLFQTTKIQIFESNSQPFLLWNLSHLCCFRLQRYKFLKAIHNRAVSGALRAVGCFRLQRYKFLKAIHNAAGQALLSPLVVSDYKDTNF